MKASDLSAFCLTRDLSALSLSQKIAESLLHRPLFVRQSSLMAQPFDVATRWLHGDPEVIARQVAANLAVAEPASAVSDAVLLYRAADPSAAESILSWFGSDGRRIEAIGGRAAYKAIRLSPDDKTLAALGYRVEPARSPASAPA